MLQNVEDEQRDVVLLGHTGWTPCVDFGEEKSHEVWRGLRLMVANYALELCISEGLALGILRFGDAVGVQDDAIGRLQRDRADRVIAPREDAK